MAGFAIGAAMLTAPGPSAAPDVRLPARATFVSARPARLDSRSFALVRQAAHLRAMALRRHRTAAYRSVAAIMGLSALLELNRVRPGRCAVAVSYLYDNLLDLRNAYPGEDWRPLRRLIRRQPSLGACAPVSRPEAVVWMVG